jgi:hypothetical protein
MVKEFNTRMRQGKNAVEMQEWAHKYNFTFHRDSFYKHRNSHMMSNADKVVQASLLIPESDKIRTTSDEDVLKGIRDLGYATAIANPENVTVGHALKALSILTAAKPQQTNVLLILARAMTTPLDEIEGEYVDYAPQLLTEGMG